MSTQTITINNNTGSNLVIETPAPPTGANNPRFAKWNGLCVDLNGATSPCNAPNASCMVLPGQNSTAVGTGIAPTGFVLKLAAYDAAGALYEFDLFYCYPGSFCTNQNAGWSLNSANPQGAYTIQYEPDANNNTIDITVSQVPAIVTFQNQTDVAINIDYPLVPSLSAWTGASTATNYSIKPGKTATGSSFSGTTFQLSAYQPNALYHFNVTISGNGSFTIPSKVPTQAEYLCNVTLTSPNNYTITIAMQPTIKFINATGNPININYPKSGLANWTGSNNNGNYQINAGMTATGTNDTSGPPGSDFLSLANASPTGAQLAAYGATGALYTYNTFFAFEVPPNTTSNPTSGYNFISSFDEGSNTYIVTITQTANLWDTSSSILKFNGTPTVLHGFALTGMEYLLRGIGMDSFDLPVWSSQTEVDITPLNIPELDAIASFLPVVSGVMPTVRISLNAAYYLGIVTSGWQANFAKYSDSNLSQDYQILLDNMIAYFNSKGIVTILDLHWNYDLPSDSKINPQRPMALKSSTTTPLGDSVQFWTLISQKYGNNPLVWYELFNEPFLQTSEYTLWRDGGTSSDGTEVYYGMKTLYAAVRANTNNPIVIGGSSNYAYDATSLVNFHNDVKPVGVVYNFHPYADVSTCAPKTPSLASIITTMQSVNAPLILTELGQYCCSDTYVNDLLATAQANNISWTLWAWRPNVTNPPNSIIPPTSTATSGAGCSGPDINNGQVLAVPFDANLPACYPTTAIPQPPPCCSSPPCGANFSTLIPKYYPVGIQK